MWQNKKVKRWGKDKWDAPSNAPDWNDLLAQYAGQGCTVSVKKKAVEFAFESWRIVRLVNVTVGKEKREFLPTDDFSGVFKAAYVASASVVSERGTVPIEAECRLAVSFEDSDHVITSRNTHDGTDGNCAGFRFKAG